MPRGTTNGGVRQPIDGRRRDLMAGLSGAVALLAAPALWAADAPGWPAKQFNQAYLKGVLAALGASGARASSLVEIVAPAMAQDGATVPFTVRTQLEDVEKVSIVVPNNPIPLAAEYHFPAGTAAYVVNRLKMKGSDDIIALAHTRGGKIFRASTHVKVTVGGCG